MTDIEFNFDLYIVQLLDSENEENRIQNIIDTRKKYCTTSTENEETLMKLFTTYLCGELDNEHTKRAINDVEKLLNDKKYCKSIYDLFKSWINEFKNFDTSKKIEILNIFLNNLQVRSYEFTKLIWSFKEIRELIKDMPLYDNAKDFVEKGIFKTLFFQNKFNYNLEKSLDSINSLITDVFVYPYLIKYLHTIIKLNEAYLGINWEESIIQKKCSKIDFNLFIFQMMKKIYENYFNEKNKEEIFKNVSLEIKNYEIENLELSQQIYITMHYNLRVFLNSFYKHYDIYRTTTKKFIPIIKKEINNNWIQDFFIEYDKFYENFKIETPYADIIIYYNFICSYIKKDNFHVIIKTQLYKIISEVLGGKVKNLHTRFLAFTIIKNYANDTGYLIFDNFFENLFKYINELNFDKLGLYYLKDKVTHQQEITNTLFQMTDFCKKINDKSKYIFPETIYRIIDNSMSIFDIFDDDFYEKIENNVLEKTYYKELYLKAIQMCLYTLLVYENIYEKKIIEQTYPEIEEKYLLFIGRIISNIKMKTGNKFQINQVRRQGETFEVSLVKLCVDIIKKKIKNKPESILEIKDKILKYLPFINEKILSDENKKNLENEIEKNYNIDNIDYPSEFLDPITYKPIVTPIMIPNIHEIFERVTIVTQIYSQGTNPYTREPLTLEELEKHNSREDIIQKINQFNKEKEKWILEKEKKDSNECENNNFTKQTQEKLELEKKSVIIKETNDKNNLRSNDDKKLA